VKKSLNRLSYLQHPPSPLKIVVAEHDGDGSFETGSSINAIYAHAH